MTAIWAPDGVLDTAFLPWRARIAEIRLHAEFLLEPVMQGEFGSVVEGQGLAQGSGNLSEHRDEPLGGSLGLPVWPVVDHEVAVTRRQRTTPSFSRSGPASTIAASSESFAALSRA